MSLQEEITHDGSPLCLQDLSDSLLELDKGDFITIIEQLQSAAAADTNFSAYAATHNQNNSGGNDKVRNSQQAGTSNTSPSRQDKKRSRTSSTTEPVDPASKRVKRVPANLEEAFRRLRGCKEKSQKFNYHLEYLNKYLDDDIVPRGLMPVIKPAIGKTDELFLTNWNNALKLCGLTLVKLSRNKCAEICSELEPEIAALTSKLDHSGDEGKNTIKFIDELIARRVSALTAKKDSKITADKQGTRPQWKGRRQAIPRRQQQGPMQAFASILQGLQKAMKNQ